MPKEDSNRGTTANYVKTSCISMAHERPDEFRYP